MKVLAIVGPTGVGKSEVAQLLAENLHGEIISADSMQVYRGLNIGTGKVLEHKRRVPHHCLDIAEVDEAYSAAEYQRDARAAIDSCLDRKVVPLVCGGTGLYVRAALDEMHFVPPDADSTARRVRLERELADHGPQEMYRRLLQADPDAATHVHPNNVIRTIRALEMAELGTPYSAQVAGFQTRTSHYAGTVYVGMTAEREALYRAIETRIDAMIASGWVGEVEEFERRGLGDALLSKGAIGYPELVQVVRGLRTLPDAVAAIKQGTRRYAKRQLTWFRADPRVRWIDRTSMGATDVAAEALRLAQIETME